jgi:hypothetical protein
VVSARPDAARGKAGGMVQIGFPDRADDELVDKFSAVGQRDGLVSGLQFTGKASLLAGEACARF